MFSKKNHWPACIKYKFDFTLLYKKDQILSLICCIRLALLIFLLLNSPLCFFFDKK